MLILLLILRHVKVISRLFQLKINLQKKKIKKISYIFKNQFQYKTACVYFIKTLAFFFFIVIGCTYKAFNMYMARNETLKTIHLRVALKQT